ncbi:hypothetical protein KGO5_02113 [Sinorhizobium sp. KGO-5]|nr:hypothetical protein KGO5_02113 [Sinorhizobium sp. KGO-5]
MTSGGTWSSGRTQGRSFSGDVEVPRQGLIGQAAEKRIVRRSNERQGQIRGDHDAGHRSRYLRNRHGISACMQLKYSGRLSRMSARIVLTAFTQDPAGDEAGSGLRSCDQADPQSVRRIYVAVRQHGRMIARGIREVKPPGRVTQVRKHPRHAAGAALSPLRLRSRRGHPLPRPPWQSQLCLLRGHSLPELHIPLRSRRNDRGSPA